MRFVPLILALLCASTPAFAQATRTWVSGLGDDANPCSRTAPCKTLAGAISKTAARGEINVLDPAGVASDQQGAQVLREIGRDGEFPAVEGSVTDAGDSVLCFNNERHVVPSGGRHHYPCIGDLHWFGSFYFVAT